MCCCCPSKACCCCFLLLLLIILVGFFFGFGVFADGFHKIKDVFHLQAAGNGRPFIGGPPAP